MTRRTARNRTALLGLGLGLALLLAPSAARAQIGQPILPTEDQRSGLLTRWIAPPSFLPPDPDRDYLYWGKKWGDRLPTRPNWPLTSGLYGQRFTNACTATYSPYFWGTPGGSTAGECCQPVHPRIIGNFVHPWRPVGGYYSGGAATPIYDLDPIAPGPGPFPFPLLYKRQHQGG